MVIVLTTLLTCTLDIWVFKYHDTTNSINYLCFLAALSLRISAVVSWLLIASLHSSRCSINYPVSYHTYYSLIRAVYVFRACALFCPRIVSPLLLRYYPHVLSISYNCLAPPHIFFVFLFFLNPFKFPVRGTFFNYIWNQMKSLHF